ncbi:substrate-binding domain-containing protein [Streptomyces sp. MBT62]|uniref:substrate-binding domain-containing protein n=1 Tax=Streptomyces sp. MBT62 TaxID=2800410 RepID=UPI00190D2672|nr:substrate-binding domain-containing protein [Streptomyces sp. MBT62]MBK3564732.1 substrate-binding domain-containing protein [Streptomyces sp. MBT62]
MPNRNRTRGLTATAAAFSLALLAAACSNQATSGSTAKATDSALPGSCTKGKPVLGVALPNTVNPYYVAMRQSFIDNGAKNGFDVKVAIANDSDSTQLSQINSFVQQGVCAVALNAVNSGPGAASVAALNQAKIPVFSVNVIISPDDLKTQNASIVQYVGADQTEGGKAMGEQLLKDKGATAKIQAGIVGDPDQIPTNQRDAGFKAALKPNTSAKVGPTVNSKVDPNVSLQVTTDMLQGNPGINVIFADTGPGTVGALQAISQLGKTGKVTLYGFCAADTALTATYKACAAQEPADYARIVVENVKKYVGGSKVPAQVLQPLKIFTKGTPGPGEVG